MEGKGREQESTERRGRKASRRQFGQNIGYQMLLGGLESDWLGDLGGKNSEQRKSIRPEPDAAGRAFDVIVAISGQVCAAHAP